MAESVGVSVRTLKRWAIDPASEFPKPISINCKLYWDQREVESYLDGKFKERDKEQARIREVLRFEKRSS